MPNPITYTDHNIINSSYRIFVANALTFIHDKNGKMTNDGNNAYQWDAFGRLRKITRKSDSIVLGQFRYDAQNRRVYHVAPFAESSIYGNIRRYVYSGAQLLSEYYIDYGQFEQILDQYVYGVYLDEIWMRKRSIPGQAAEYLYFHHDPLYSVCGVTDTSGNLLEAYEYDPYGARTVITDGPDPDFIVNFTSDDLRGAASPRFVKPAFTG